MMGLASRRVVDQVHCCLELLLEVLVVLGVLGGAHGLVPEVLMLLQLVDLGDGLLGPVLIPRVLSQPHPAAVVHQVPEHDLGLGVRGVDGGPAHEQHMCARHGGVVVCDGPLAHLQEDEHHCLGGQCHGLDSGGGGVQHAHDLAGLGVSFLSRCHGVHGGEVGGVFAHLAPVVAHCLRVCYQEVGPGVREGLLQGSLLREGGSPRPVHHGSPLDQEESNLGQTIAPTQVQGCDPGVGLGEAGDLNGHDGLLHLFHLVHEGHLGPRLEG
mmetsp:Transcript_14004/g.30290  ORF Transcript_14004/g.30290 Transcript_14004/m.30290 type:complete len:268 (-) Transcript_14004:1174-1977(-)